MNCFFKDRNGHDLFLLGLQAHNSSTGTDMLDKTIHAIKLYHGNTLETPIYWYDIEPNMDIYRFAMVKDTIDRARAAHLHLILLWFGTSKNGHPNYVPEYIKLDPTTYQVAIGADGAPVASLSPHCMATLDRDARAFERLMTYIAQYDAQEGTVIAVQIENEMGLSNTDRDYSAMANQDYAKPLPEALYALELEDCGKHDGTHTWRGHFGRHAHEAFSAWHHALFIQAIATRGRAAYAYPALITNVMIGESGYEETGRCYNAGAAVGRVLDIWKIAAPTLDMICPDIYNPERSVYDRICSRYAREDNALFIPECSTSGEANAVNAMVAVANFGAVGICCFGAESALHIDGTLTDAAYPMAVTMRALANLSPLILRLRGTGNIHVFVQEEYAKKQYLRLEDYHVVAHYLQGNTVHGLGSRLNLRDPQNQVHLQARGRGLLIQTGAHEFFLAGAGLALEFIRRPDPSDENPYPHLCSRQSSQLNFLSVEEGHFEGDTWVVDYLRNGDESNFNLYAHEGQVVRIRLNPNVGM